MIFLKVFQLLSVFGYDDIIVEDLADEWDTVHLKQLFQKGEVKLDFFTDRGHLVFAIKTLGVSDVYTDVDLSIDVYGETIVGTPAYVFTEMSKHNPVATTALFHHLQAFSLLAENIGGGTKFDLVFPDGVTSVKINHIKYD
jgi:hypothetical protein